jgi:hypothetical protein
MTLDQILSLSGLVVAIFFGIIGLAVKNEVKSKQVKQSQKVSSGSIGIQVGRDLKIEK